MELLINVLLLFFALVGSIAAIGGKTWDEDLVFNQDAVPKRSLLRWVANKLHEWKQRLEPRGWVALTCLLAAFVLGIVQQLYAKSLLDQREQQASENNKELIARLDEVRSQLKVLVTAFASQPPPADSGTAKTRQALLENAQRTVDEATPVLVTSVTERRYPDGRYFDFDSERVDKLLGRTDWDKHVFLVSKSRDSGFRRAVFWRGRDDAPGGARGRLLPKGRPGDWKKGEIFYLKPKDYGPWDPKEQ